MEGLFLCLVLVFIYFIWGIRQQRRVQALKYLQRYCQQQQLQLLDDTLVLVKWSIRSGQLALEFNFEFTSTGAERYLGRLILVGRRIDSIDLATYRAPDQESS